VEQKTFSDLEFEHKKKRTRREQFLERMDGLIPWRRLEKKIRRHYPKAGRGRRPYPLSVMLRIHCVQLFYNMSDPAMEDMLYEIESVRRFAGLKLAGPIPDETTILNFRHLLEKHGLGKKLFEEINRHLADQDLMLKEGTVIDASIVSAPSSTKNKKRERDPEMHQTKKGNEWFFGMKMHIGVDEKLGLVHSLATSAANVHDIAAADQLLHGKEKAVWADAGYQGIGKREEHEDRKVRWHVAMKPGKRSQLDPDGKEAKKEKAKASIRAKVEHPFLYVKRVFGYSKIRYRGLAKNTERLSLLLGFANLLIGARYA
jgi:IS5 family transposase